MGVELVRVLGCGGGASESARVWVGASDGAR